MPTKAQKAEQAAACETLRKLLKPGDTVYTVLRHVSTSGMQREVSLHYVEGGEVMWLTGLASRVGLGRIGKHDGIIVQGCGMDTGFHLVYNLARYLWPDGFPCIGGSCPSNHHSNSREPEAHHVDGGYALRHRWI